MGADLSSGPGRIAIRTLVIRETLVREIDDSSRRYDSLGNIIPLSLIPVALPRLTEAALRASEGVSSGYAWALKDHAGNTWAALFDANGTMLSKPRLLPA